MTISAAELREWEQKCPDAVVLLVRDYKSMQVAIITVPRASIAAAEAKGRHFPWRHGHEIELHTNGEVCECVSGPFGPSAMPEVR